MKMKTKNIFSILISCAAISFMTACTNLDEELYGRLSPDTFYQNEDEALASVVGVYQRLSNMSSAGGEGWRIALYESDEMFCPGRVGGGWYEEGTLQLQSHTVTPNNGPVNRAWTTVFGIIGAANAVLESLEQSPMAGDLSALIAETRALRAYGYFYALDLWGNVPIFTDARVDANNLPTTNTRKEVYDFVVKEFEEAAAGMPSVTEVDRTSYYPRFTREAIYTALAAVYLNAEVYADTPQWDKVVEKCDLIIKTGAYGLEDKVGDCFLSTNENNREVISAFAIDPSRSVGGNQFMLYAQHALDQKRFNLPFAPACGYCFTDDALNRYNEPADERLELLQYGKQYLRDGVTPLTDDNDVQLEFTTIKSMIAAENHEGYRVLKYSPVGAVFAGSDGDNDYVLERYANVLLMKAEALFRQGDTTGEALRLVNEVRDRSEASEWTDLTLQKIEDERARELIWENQRKRDQVRFGSFFNKTWYYKETTTEEWRGVLPIPEIQRTNNPNLVQNFGY